MTQDEVLIHRVLAKHAAREVCAECPQPETDRLIREAKVEKVYEDFIRGRGRS